MSGGASDRIRRPGCVGRRPGGRICRDGRVVADADRLLELARQAWLELPEDSAQRQSIVDGAELLGQLLSRTSSARAAMAMAMLMLMLMLLMTG